MNIEYKISLEKQEQMLSKCISEKSDLLTHLTDQKITTEDSG